MKCALQLQHTLTTTSPWQSLYSQTRDTSSQCHEGNSIDRILQVDEAAQMTGDITNNSSTDSNHGDGNDEAGVAIRNA